MARRITPRAPLLVLRTAAAVLLAACYARGGGSAPSPDDAPELPRVSGAAAGTAGSTVTEGAIDRRRAASIEELLQGLPGVHVTGRAPNLQVRIRGAGTINASGEPLYVLDGMPLPAGTNALRNIPPADVARIDVLRDGASTALYGVRGANGVIVIETKRGP